MRYLLTVILVLALASPAWSECIDTPRELLDKADTDKMPQYSAEYLIGSCQTFDWTFDLTFTPGSGRTEVDAYVLGSDVHVEEDSKDYKESQRVENSDSGTFGLSQYYQLKIDVSGDTGHWTDMDLRVFNQSE